MIEPSADGCREAHAARVRMLERLQTACQQVCPTQAITFGSIIDRRRAR